MAQLETKPARIQVTESELTGQDSPQPIGTVYNIWYRRWAGGDKDPSLSRRRNPYKCNISQDSGYTKADKVPGSYFCLYFARGVCYKGDKCDYLHRLPTASDVYPPAVDCFGRERFSSYRDDMAGVGSFLQENKSLYVAGITKKDGLQGAIFKNFKEWGAIDKVKVLEGRGIAFVGYKNEINAQFAKEAMSNQSIGGPKEILTVKWATQDPNPHAAHQAQKSAETSAMDTIRAVLAEKNNHEKLKNTDYETLHAEKVQESATTGKRPAALLSESAVKKLKSSLVDYSDSD